MDNLKKAAFSSWSGGKDSCLALHRALRQDLDVRYLLTMFDETEDRSRSHAVSGEMIAAQADALKIQLITAKASWQNYEKVFIEQLKSFNSNGITHGIFGDIDLEPHREWEEKVCTAAKIEAVLPLWSENRRKLVDEFIAEGFKAVVVCVNEKYLDSSFCGRLFDESFLADLPENVDACGENGEFHTFVFDGKMFDYAVKFNVAEIYRHETKFPSGDVSKFSYAKITK
jgi:diphthine-ammonia ligase